LPLTRFIFIPFRKIQWDICSPILSHAGNIRSAGFYAGRIAGGKVLLAGEGLPEDNGLRISPSALKDPFTSRKHRFFPAR
jgi:hypothetical protein